jgi:hypothetical protein
VGYIEEGVTVPQAPAPSGVRDADPEEPPSRGVIAIAGAARVKRVTTVGGVIAIAGAARVKRVTTVGGVIAIAGAARVKRVTTVRGWPR